MSQVSLTEKQIFTAVNALRASAEIYGSDAKAMRSLAATAGLAPQFERQQAEALELADMLESFQL